MSAQGFRVEWELFAPVIVPTMPLHLDSLLSWSRVYEEELRCNPQGWDLQHDLPLERHETPHGWCFMASAVKFDWEGPRQQLHFIKRSNIDDYAKAYMEGVFRKKPYFDPLRGATKAGSVVMHQQFAQRATAFGIGDIDRVRELLRNVNSLGKLKRRGKGAIKSCVVVPDPSAEKLWVRRNLPLGSHFASPSTHAHTQARLYAPYWSKERHDVLAPFA